MRALGAQDGWIIPVRSWWCAHSASLLCRTHQKTWTASPSGGNAMKGGVRDSILLTNLIDTLLFGPLFILCKFIYGSRLVLVT